MPPLSRAQREGREPLDPSNRAFPSSGAAAQGSSTSNTSRIGGRREGSQHPFGQSEENAVRRTRAWTSKREVFEEKVRLERAARVKEEKEEERRARERSQIEIRSKKTLRLPIDLGDEGGQQGIPPLEPSFTQNKEWI